MIRRRVLTRPKIPGGDQLDLVAPDVCGGQVVGADLAREDLVIWSWAPS